MHLYSQIIVFAHSNNSSAKLVLSASKDHKLANKMLIIIVLN